jgi:hypothetical protein
MPKFGELVNEGDIEKILNPEKNTKKTTEDANTEELKKMGHTKNEDGEWVFNKKQGDVVGEINYKEKHAKNKKVTRNPGNLDGIHYTDEEDGDIDFYEEGGTKKNDFENQDILGEAFKKMRGEMEKARKNLPEISQGEKEMMLKDFPRLLKALVNKKRFEKEDVSEEAALELVKEVMDNFPNEYVKLIHGERIPKVQKYNWKKEKFKGKDYFVSYYPNEENPSIKYIHRNPDEKTDIFLARTKKKTKNKKGEVSSSIMKTNRGKGPYLVFLGE